MNLPAERQFGWTLKPVITGGTQMIKLDNGQVVLIIEHEVIKGVTRDMLVWWFQHFTSITVQFQGKKYPAYHLWHTRDHIEVSSTSKDGINKVGDTLHIRECFQRNPEYCLKVKGKIWYFKKDGFGLRSYKGGLKVMELLHRFTDTPDGVQYDSKMVFGLEKGLLRSLVNNVLIPKRFGEDKMTAWFQHNIEEVGCFENFLPQLYERRSQGMHINVDE